MRKVVYGLGLLLSSSVTANAQQQRVQKDSTYYYSKKTIPSDLYVKQLSFFCRNEWMIQKYTGKNIFFRLGSKDYVDYLEHYRKTPNP